jgi:hypothetical protein
MQAGTHYFLLRPTAEQWPTGHKAEVRVNWPATRPAAFQLKLVRGRKDPSQVLVQVQVQKEGIPLPGIGQRAEKEPIMFSVGKEWMRPLLRELIRDLDDSL